MSAIADILRGMRPVSKTVKLHEKYVSVFGTSDGQEVLEHILRNAYVFDSTFVRGDVYETMLREGERRLALSILRFFSKDHGVLQKMAENIYNRSTEE
ncbi:MAG TPA: hypothetical protein PLO50_00885 [Nitrospira sp.]|nr:hypothetical protein [Nitrospira sp.]